VQGERLQDYEGRIVMTITLQSKENEFVGVEPLAGDYSLGNRIENAVWLLINNLDTENKQYIVTVDVEEVK
jgi:hypothetical protein